jgi:hypothetical protein
MIGMLIAWVVSIMTCFPVTVGLVYRAGANFCQ